MTEDRVYVLVAVDKRATADAPADVWMRHYLNQQLFDDQFAVADISVLFERTEPDAVRWMLEQLS